jgi:hypothetical protein
MNKMNEKKSLKEHLEKIKYYTNYKVSETPKYKPVIDNDMEFDEVPATNYSTQDSFPVPNTGGSDAYLEEQGDEGDENNDDKIPAPEGPKEPREPTNARRPEEEGVPEGQPEDDTPDEQPDTGVDINQPDEPVETGEEDSVDDVQNDIIKHNIEAMKNIHSKLEDLENINSQLENQLGKLSSKVKEVEEPSDAEKMMSKKEESYPYYFNLNDFWKNNWFDQKREQQEENGIKKLPDGTYIADFDDLPVSSEVDIEDSFNSII